MLSKLKLLCAIALLVCLGTPLQAQTKKLNVDWEIGPTGSKASFRGLSSPESQPDSVWLCGSKSTVIRSLDGGTSWQDVSPSFGELEFRSIKVFSDQNAVIASAGTPAIILLTKDGGESWQEVYRNDAKTAFFDSMQFWDEQRGLAVSDPVDGRFLLVQTKDGGHSWSALTPESSPIAQTGEACFAASNSAMLLGDNESIWIGTGGSEQGFARVLYRPNASAAWQAFQTPLPSNASSGIFSLFSWKSMDTKSKSEGALNPTILVVGGDYRPGETSAVTGAYSNDRGKSWKKVGKQPAQFRSAVLGTNARNPVLITVGPEGSDYSLDGETWTSFSNHGFHAMCKAGDRLYATGSAGRFARLKLD